MEWVEETMALHSVTYYKLVETRRTFSSITLKLVFVQEHVGVEEEEEEEEKWHIYTSAHLQRDICLEEMLSESGATHVERSISDEEPFLWGCGHNMIKHLKKYFCLVELVT